MDLHGYLMEAISERSDGELMILARRVRDNHNGAYTLSIGGLVSGWIMDYCKPSETDVIEALEKERM